MPDPRLVLGVTWGTHDSAAALFCAGRLVGFVEEERLSGAKHTGAFPRLAIEWLLAELGATRKDVGAVASGFRAAGYALGGARAVAQAARRPRRRRAWARARSYGVVYHRTRARLRYLRSAFPEAQVLDLPHHLCHSAYAYGAAGVSSAAILSVDSVGEWYSAAVIHADPLGQEIVTRVADPHSLGYLYGAVTEHLGYVRGDEEGTVMALAAFGDPERYRPLFEKAVVLTDDGLRLDPDLLAPRVFSTSWPRLADGFVDETFARRTPTETLGARHRNLAAALQLRSEQALLHLAGLAARRTGADTLCLVGGVAMNCLAAGCVSAAGIFDRVSVPPAPGDAGTCIGAALLAIGRNRAGDGEQARADLARWDLGPRFNPTQIDRALACAGHPVQVVAEPARVLADDLAAGRIVGLFRGALEAGPRALGHRSILASPVIDGITERLSSRVKLRESFRPFAPVVPEESVNDLFVATDRSPYMSLALKARPRARELAPSVVHVNGTARVQTLRRTEDPFLHEVLHRFAEKTGVPALINTSMNVKGSPMAATPEQALECLRSCSLDAILLEDRYTV
jgi:carbamoyltransferase